MENPTSAAIVDAEAKIHLQAPTPRLEACISWCVTCKVGHFLPACFPQSGTLMTICAFFFFFKVPSVPFGCDRRSGQGQRGINPTLPFLQGVSKYLARFLTMTTVIVVFFFYPSAVETLLEIFDCDTVDTGAPSSSLMVSFSAWGMTSLEARNELLQQYCCG